MKAFEVNLQTEPVIIFTEPEKAQFFFIDDPDPKAWGKFFWKVDNLGKLAQMLGRMMYHQRDSWGSPYLEGFGVAKWDDNKRAWVLENEDYGSIIMEVEELDHHWDYVDVSENLDKGLARLVK